MTPPDVVLLINFLDVMLKRMREWDDFEAKDPYQLQIIESCRCQVLDLIANLEALL